MTVAARTVGITRGLKSPSAISGLTAWFEADQISVASVQPNTIAGLQLWLKADAIAGKVDGDTITTWSDSSGNGYDATGSATKPTYKTGIVNSLPVVRFNGTNNFMKLLSAGFLASTANVTGVTVFAVVNATSNGVQKKVLHISNNASATPRFALLADSSNHWGIAVKRLDADGTTSLTGTTALPGAFQVVSAQCNYNPRPGTGVWLQGANDAKTTTLTTAGSTSNTSSADAFIGSGSTTPTNPFNGDIAEIIVYNVALTNQQRLAVEKYLCDKYALTAIGCPYVNNDVVQTWPDLSGNGYDLIQNTAAGKPVYKTAILNGKPTVRFNGTASTMPILPGTSIPTIAQPFTYVIVAQENDLTVDTNCFMDTGNPTSVKFSGTWNAHPTNPSQYLMDSGTGFYSGTNADTSWHVYTVNWNSPNSYGRKDGVTQIGPHDVGSLSASTIVVGSVDSGIDKFFHGDFAAVLLYNKALSNAELNLIGQYYAAKYGLSWTAV